MTEPEALASFDRRIVLGADNVRRRSDVLVLARIPVVRRRLRQLPVPPEPTLLDHWLLQPYVISPFSVRVQ